MEMEHKEYASKGVAGTALGLGAGSLTLGVINGMVELLQGWQRNQCGHNLGSDAVTTGTTTTAQLLYNPIPDCGCGCGRGN